MPNRRLSLLAVAAAGTLLLGAAPALAAPDAAGAPGRPDSGAHKSAAGPHTHRTKKVCATPKKHEAGCHAVVVLPDTTDPAAGSVAPDATTATPAGFGPADLQSAYGLPGGSAGAGVTVAIVDAYDLPTAQSDLNTYRAAYGLPPCGTGCFRKVNQRGGSTPPAADASWGQEIALDLDMVSAACPACNILLVEADSPTLANLGAAVNTAVALGAAAVSNSYGGSESSQDPTYDEKYFRHPGVAITASSGDYGYGTEYPAASQYVTAVGGTSLTRSGTARGWSESAWSGAGSGCSAYDAKPAAQTDTGCTRRSIADVAAVADPQTGVAVYDSTPSGGQSGWLVFGGTSAAAPLIAAIYAQAGGTGGSEPYAYPYAHTGALNDITTGSNGSCSVTYLCRAGVGYDGPTGLGTPAGLGAFGTAAGSTPPPPPPPPPANLLGNPGFENGADPRPWTATSGVVTDSISEAAHGGQWYAWLDGYGTSHTDTVTQSVTIPSGAAAQLSFWLHVDTAETSTTRAYDKLQVQVLSSSGSVLKTLATYSNLNAAPGYDLRTLDLSGYAGRTVSLRFRGVENASRATSFVVDDVALSS